MIHLSQWGNTWSLATLSVGQQYPLGNAFSRATLSVRQHTQPGNAGVAFWLPALWQHRPSSMATRLLLRQQTLGW
ncbi:MAG: hypothetical protein ACFB10_18935 [Salibacteraceae bacterium]